MIRHVALTILGGLMLAGVGPARADDSEAGRRVAQMCQSCHGMNGYATMPVAPHIGGEPKAYLEAQLMAFKTGARENEMMSVVAAGLSEQQISDVAAWYAAQHASATLAEGVDPAGAPAACVECHGATGIADVPEAPNLAGENAMYIDAQLKAFKRGQRVHEVMSDIAAALDDADIRAAADWYSAIDLEIATP